MCRFPGSRCVARTQCSTRASMSPCIMPRKTPPDSTINDPAFRNLKKAIRRSQVLRDCRRSACLPLPVRRAKGSGPDLGSKEGAVAMTTFVRRWREKVGGLSGDRETCRTERFTHERHDLFPLREPVRRKERYAAGRFTDACPDLERLVARPHTVGGESKHGG